MLKTWPLPRTVVCGGGGGGGWGGGGQDVITIQTSTMTLHRVCRPVLACGAVVTNAFHSYNARVGICVL